MSFQTYEVLPGAINEGERYETVFVANMALQLVLDECVKNFLISSNNQEFHPFDDVVVEIEKIDGRRENLGLQLKHSDRPLTFKNLTGKSGDFSLQKYIEGYSKFRHQSTNTKWILYTNRKFNNKVGVDFKLDHGDFDIKMSVCKSEQVFTSENGLSYKFEVDASASAMYHRFFENFDLYTNQLNVYQMEMKLSKRFQEEFHCEETAFVKYLNFIAEWNMKKGRREKLNKFWMKEVIVMQVLSPLIQPLSSDVVTDKKYRIFRNAINNFDITFFEKRHSPSIIRLWSTQELKEVDKREINYVGKKYQIISKTVQDAHDLTNEESSKILWLLNKCPLIIKYTGSIARAIRLCENKKFIILCKHSSNIDIKYSFKNTSVFQNLSDLSKNSSVYIELVKIFCCSLQGKAEITLENLIGESEEFRKSITTDDLILFLTDKFTIGESRDENTLDLYIPRYFSRHIIHKNFLEIACDSMCIVIIDRLNDTSNYNKHFDVKDIETILNSERTSWSFNRLYVSKNSCNHEIIEELRKKLSENRNMSFFHFRAFGTELELLIFSGGNFHNLREFVKEETFMTEEEFYRNVMETDNKMILVCGDAGLGKSTSMLKFKKHTFPSLWTVLIYPKDHSRQLTEMEGEVKAFKKYILEETGKKFQGFDLKVFETLLKHDRVNYIWDGLDEVSENSLNPVVSMIEAIFKMGVKQSITSRNNLKNSLEEKFSVFAKSIKQFDEEEQKHYVQKRLDCEGSELENIFTKIKSQIDFLKYNEILAIPLQIYMFTELFIQDREKYVSLLNNTFALTDLYEHFIDIKFDIYFKDKENCKDVNDTMMERNKTYKKHRIAQYELLALEVHFRGTFLGLNHNTKMFLDELKAKDVIGIVNAVSPNNIVSFLHHSYGEYFAASYISKNYENLPNLQFLFVEQHKNVRFMLDLMLAKDRPVHMAILCKNFDLVETYTEDLLKTKDEGGRNALQILCSWGRTFPSLNVEHLVEKKRFKKIHKYKVYGETSVPAERYEYIRTLKFLLNYCDPEEKDRVHRLSALSYSAAIFNLWSFSILMVKANLDHINNLIFAANTPTLLCYSAIFDFANVFDNIQKIPLVYTENRETILHLAAKNNSLLSCGKILSKYNLNVDSVDVRGETPLSKACESGHIGMIELLIKEGADVNHRDNFDTTPLHLACGKGYVDVAKFLINSGANIDCRNRFGETPLFKAELAQFLIESGVNINRANNYGETPLLIASKKEHVNIVTLLISAGADIENSKNNDFDFHKQLRAFRKPTFFFCIESAKRQNKLH